MIEIHHLGVVSRDITSGLRYFQIDKSQIIEIIDDDIQNHLLHIIPMKNHNMWLEILVPKNEKSTTFNFAKKFNVGLHHLGYLCENISLKKEEFSNNMDAVYLGTHKTKISAYGGNVNTLFFSIKGMISEFVEQKN